TQTVETVVAETVRQFAAKLAETEPLLAGITDIELLALWLTPSIQTVTPAAPAAEGEAPAEPAPEPELQFAYSQQLAGLARTGLRSVLTFGILTPEGQNAELQISSEKQIRILRDTTVDSQFRQ